MENEFVSYTQALALKELGFDEESFGHYRTYGKNLFYATPIARNLPARYRVINAPLYQQAINFLYICSNKQIDIELKGSDTYEERVRKINQGCEDLRNLQNNKSNQ